MAAKTIANSNGDLRKRDMEELHDIAAALRHGLGKPKERNGMPTERQRMVKYVIELRGSVAKRMRKDEGVEGRVRELSSMALPEKEDPFFAERARACSLQ
jgi:hypothetical protein